MLITEKLALLVKEQPNHLITQFNGRNTTYAEFYEQARRLAGYFHSKGFEKEDIIAVYLPNSDYFLTCYYACQLGGYTVMPVNTKLTAVEIEYILNHSEAKALIYDVRLESILNEISETFNRFAVQLQVGGRKHFSPY